MNFWAQFQKGTCFPSCGCEPLLDAIIMQPQAFWSSLAYTVAGIVLYRRVEKKSFDLKLWVFMLVYLTVSSMFAHASYLKVALAMDFSGIIILLSFFSVLNLMKLLKRSHKEMVLWFSVYAIILTIAFYFISGPPRIALSVLIFFFALGDLVRDLRSELWRERARPFWMCLWILFFSFCCFLADTMHIICDPDGLVHGHTFWHIGTGVSAYFYGAWRFHLPRRFSRKAS